jgi:hypothetical protein
VINNDILAKVGSGGEVHAVRYVVVKTRLRWKEKKRSDDDGREKCAPQGHEAEHECEHSKGIEWDPEQAELSWAIPALKHHKSVADVNRLHCREAIERTKKPLGLARDCGVEVE